MAAKPPAREPHDLLQAGETRRRDRPRPPRAHVPQAPLVGATSSRTAPARPHRARRLFDAPKIRQDIEASIERGHLADEPFTLKDDEQRVVEVEPGSSRRSSRHTDVERIAACEVGARDRDRRERPGRFGFGRAGTPRRACRRWRTCARAASWPPAARPSA